MFHWTEGYVTYQAVVLHYHTHLAQHRIPFTICRWGTNLLLTYSPRVRYDKVVAVEPEEKLSTCWGRIKAEG
ncbi:hypothetical protein ACFL6S_06255 [Candidatus Poribacteria bacterium]